MKKIILITSFLLTTFALADDRPLSDEAIKLERQKLQLQREWLELEKKKYELEKQKYLDEQEGYLVEYDDEPDEKTSSESPFARNMYVGLDYTFVGSGQRSLSVNGIEGSGDGIAVSGSGIKLGFGKADENRIELFCHQERFTFDDAENDWNVILYGIDYLFVYYEAFDKKLSPYLKIGVTMAESDTYLKTVKELGYTAYSETSTIGGAGLKLGFGFYYLINDRIEISLGVDHVTINWHELRLASGSTTHKVKISDTINTNFVNFDYFF